MLAARSFEQTYVLIVSIGLVLLCAAWVFVDARRRGMDGGAWAAGVLLLWIIVFPIYLFARRAPEAMARARLRNPKRCPDCAELVHGAARVCRYCGHSFATASAPRTTNARRSR